MTGCNTCRYKERACTETAKAENKDKVSPPCYKPLLIPSRKWEQTPDDYKDISKEGHRIWLTMIDGVTCLLTEGKHFEVR